MSYSVHVWDWQKSNTGVFFDAKVWGVLKAAPNGKKDERSQNESAWATVAESVFQASSALVNKSVFEAAAPHF